MISLRRDRGPERQVADDDVLARLWDCHARIRRTSAEARALAALAGGDRDPRAAASARDVSGYFERGLLLHAEDEDLSIAPLLPSSCASVVAELAAQHHEIESRIAALSPAWARRAQGEPLGAGAEAHREDVDALVALLDRHLALEEATLFPAIAALPASARRDIVGQMRARRR